MYFQLLRSLAPRAVAELVLVRSLRDATAACLHNARPAETAASVRVAVRWHTRSTSPSRGVVHTVPRDDLSTSRGLVGGEAPARRTCLDIRWSSGAVSYRTRCRSSGDSFSDFRLRVMDANRSNHAMERTADRLSSASEMTSTIPLRATRALVRRRSSYFR